MSENPYKPEVSVFSVAYTRFLMSWNDLEDTARKIIESTGENAALTAILSGLGTLALQDAIKAIANAPPYRGIDDIDKYAELLLHFEKGMDRLRAHRNFYVHAIRGMGKDPGNPDRFHAQFMAYEAKGKYRLNQVTVSAEEMMSLVHSLGNFSAFGKTILKATSHPGRDVLLGKTKKLKLKDVAVPDLPEPIAKNRIYPGQQRPSQS